MQKRRDGNHRALGLEPEATQGLEVFDRPRRTPSDAAALFHTILELSPPEQTARGPVQIKYCSIFEGGFKMPDNLICKSANASVPAVNGAYTSAGDTMRWFFGAIVAASTVLGISDSKAEWCTSKKVPAGFTYTDTDGYRHSCCQGFSQGGTCVVKTCRSGLASIRPVRFNYVKTLKSSTCLGPLVN